MPRVGKREFDYGPEGTAKARKYAKATGKSVTISKKKHKGKKIRVKVQKKKLGPRRKPFEGQDPKLRKEFGEWWNRARKPKELPKPIPKPRERIKGDEWAKKPRERIKGDEWADQSPIRKVKPKVRPKPERPPFRMPKVEWKIKPKPGAPERPKPKRPPLTLPKIREKQPRPGAPKKPEPLRPWDRFRKPIKEQPQPGHRDLLFRKWLDRKGKPAKTREELELEWKRRLKRMQLRGR